MTEIPSTPTIETAVSAIMRDMIGDVLDGAGLAVMRGPVGIGKSYALRQTLADFEADGARITYIAATGAVQGKIAEFLRVLHGRDGVSSAEGLELAFATIAGHCIYRKREGGRFFLEVGRRFLVSVHR